MTDEQKKENNQKKELFEKGVALIEKQINFIYFLQLTHDFENLKKLVLNKEQLILFNLISKPELSLSSKTNNDFDADYERCNYDTIKIILDYFEKLRLNPELATEIDRKLISFMDDDLIIALSDAYNIDETEEKSNF